MKSVSTTRNSADDGTIIQQVIRRGLTALSLAIIFLSAVAFWTVVHLTDFYQDELHSVSEQKHLLHVMRISALERILIMNNMVLEKDPFIIDDKRMTFYGAAAKFTQARIKFLKTPLTDYELGLMKKQAAITKVHSLRQEQIVDLVIKGDFDLALRSLQKLGSNKMIPLLQQINISIDKRNEELYEKADSFGAINIAILGVMVVLILLCVIYIIRQTTVRSSNLILQVNATRKMLQKTIHELIQQKSALDSHAIVSIADRQGNITYVNDKFCEISGYSRDELLGQNHRILKSDKLPDEFYQELWTTISQGKIWHGEICNRRKNGDNYWVESTISPFLDESGIPYQYVSIRTDITRILDAKIEAEATSRSKSIFISSMSHELRTPMNAILGFSQLVEMQTKDESTKEHINEVINAGNHLLGLINGILDFSQIESGKVDLFFDSYSIKEILNFCLSMTKHSADEMLLNIENKVDSLPDMNIQVDEKRFKQIVLNILSNAIKYNKKNGSVIIDYSIDDNEMLCLKVIDSGKGIALKYQNDIFKTFNRGGEENSTIAGSGLGLGISKTLIERMDGMIGFESIEDEGSTFWVKVPLS